MKLTQVTITVNTDSHLTQKQVDALQERLGAMLMETQESLSERLKLMTGHSFSVDMVLAKV